MFFIQHHVSGLVSTTICRLIDALILDIISIILRVLKEKLLQIGIDTAETKSPLSTSGAQVARGVRNPNGLYPPISA